VNPVPSPSIGDVRALSGILDDPPYSHVDFVLVAKNESARLPALLARVRPYFERVVVAVQQSHDDTEQIARKWANVVIRDYDHGFGDASMPHLQRHVRARWAFRVDADEWPSSALLWSLSNATWWADHEHAQGIWIPYRSSVEDMPYNDPHSHLRLWENGVVWPAFLHSRPHPDNNILWTTGFIDHSKSLDEFVEGYLSYLRIGRDNEGWTEHNLSQLQNATRAAAERYGWSHVTGRPWWPQVVAEAFNGEDPSATTGQQD
jgi:glycosyltransferase involved in cell wall biosynthesis